MSEIEADYSVETQKHLRKAIEQGLPLDGQIFEFDAIADKWKYVLPSGGKTFFKAVKTAFQTVTNSTVYVNDDTLNIPFTETGTFGYLLYLVIISPAAADFKWKFTKPAASAGSYAKGTLSSDVATPQGSATSDNVVLTAGGISEVIIIIGNFNIANVGNSILQWAQNVADVSDTKVQRGSFIVVWKD